MSAVAATIAPAPAMALSDFTLNGNGSTQLWSDSANWAGGVAPSGSVGTVTLNCPASVASCTANDDIPGLCAEALVLSGRWYSYSSGLGVGGSQSLTIGAGGVTTDGGGPQKLALPLVLSAAQMWTVNADLMVGNVTGAGVLLSVHGLSSLQIDGDVETGAVRLSGGVTVSVQGGSLNATSGAPVTLIDGAQLQNSDPAGSVGPLTVTGSSIDVSAVSHVNPVTQVQGPLTLDSTSTVEAGPGWYREVAPSGIWYEQSGQFDATGAVDLGGATLTFRASRYYCPVLQTGKVYTLVQTSGSLIGTFNGVPSGAVVPDGECTDVSLRINYTSNAVTATVIQGRPSPTSVGAESSPSNPVVNQPPP